MFFNDLPGQEGQESMPPWLFGGLVVVLTVFLQVWGAMSWPTGCQEPEASMLGPILGPSWARLGPMLMHLGAKLGLRWVVLGASWAILGHVGALLQGPGRHP